MINILIPAMGNSTFFKDYYFPKMMLEINGETVLEKIIHNFDSLRSKHFIFVLNNQECTKFHLDQSVKIATESNCSNILLKKQTGGALCTCLLAVDYINNETPLIIANSDQIIDVDYNDVINKFEAADLDAGVITFSNIHPRWSYVSIEEGLVVEAIDRRPVSKHAIAGFLYFKRGKDFVEAAKKGIIKESSENGVYNLSAAINEMILMQKKVGYYEVEKDSYHSFYAPEKVREYEKRIANT